MRFPGRASLFRRLMVGFGLVLLAISLGGMAHSLYDALSRQYDNTFSENRIRAREIMLTLAPVAGQPEQLLATARTVEALQRELFRDLAYLSHVRLRIWKDGRLVFNSAPELPDRLPARAGADPAIPNAWVAWTEHDARAGLVVERHHEVDDAWVLTAAGARYLFMPFVSNLLLLMLAAWWIVATGLRPLRDIAALIAQRSDADLSPLPDSHYRELSPLVNAINGLMTRLGARIAREHEVLVDAAHELKTPLAAIQLNAHLVLSRAEAGNLAGSLEAGESLREGVTRATHNVHQLLALERLGADSTSSPPARLDAAGFLRDRLAIAAALAVQRGIDIELDIELGLDRGPPCLLLAHRESLAAMLDNLVGNAIKYSPDGGAVSVRLARCDDLLRLTISDQGPGIDPSLRTKVFERFYRVPGQAQSGSGLGLAIARRAATRCGATIRLGAGAHGVGLCVTVDFTEVQWAAQPA
ncbi:MAG: sensor histidine kinase [Gammaproteobacteria bacterium]